MSNHAFVASSTADAVIKFQVWQAQAMLNAASRGMVANVQQLLDRGCPVDVCDYDRRTGLMLAAANGHEVSKCVQFCHHYD
jgi:ankyrin repeat protein